MKNTRRAIRRNHRQRMINRVLKSYALQCYVDSELKRNRALRRYNNRKVCSCFMCGNPRKFENRRPFQEERLHEAALHEAAYYEVEE